MVILFRYNITHQQDSFATEWKCLKRELLEIHWGINNVWDAVINFIQLKYIYSISTVCQCLLVAHICSHSSYPHKMYKLIECWICVTTIFVLKAHRDIPSCANSTVTEEQARCNVWHWSYERAKIKVVWNSQALGFPLPSWTWVYLNLYLNFYSSFSTVIIW